MLNPKQLKYQPRYLKHALSQSEFIVVPDDSGVEIILKKQPVILAIYLCFILSLGLFFANYILEEHVFLYVLSASFFVLGMSALVLSGIRDKNHFFRIDYKIPSITYCVGLRKKRRSFPLNDQVKISCEIDIYGSRHRQHTSYSATIYKTLVSTGTKKIILQSNGNIKFDQEIFAKAMKRFLEETALVKEVEIIENGQLPNRFFSKSLSRL